MCQASLLSRRDTRVERWLFLAAFARAWQHLVLRRPLRCPAEGVAARPTHRYTEQIVRSSVRCVASRSCSGCVGPARYRMGSNSIRAMTRDAPAASMNCLAGAWSVRSATNTQRPTSARRLYPGSGIEPRGGLLSRYGTGNRIVNTLPRPTSLSRVSLPPIPSTALRARAKPKPEPAIVDWAIPAAR